MPATENMCNECNKIYKTKAGLNRHQKKHINPIVSLNTFTKAKLLDLLIKIRELALINENYPSDLMKILSKVNFVEIDLLWTKVDEIYMDFYESGNAEKLYTTMFCDVITNAENLLSGINIDVSSLVLKKLVDEMLALRKSMMTATNYSVDLSDKELGTLSHIGGYVLRNIYKKIKNSKNWHEKNSQMAIAFLDAARATGALDDQSFYGALNRGNLWKITTDAENIFKIAEIKFRLKTSQKPLRYIDIESIISSSLNDPFFVRSNHYYS